MEEIWAGHPVSEEGQALYSSWNHIALASVKAFSFRPVLVWCHLDLVRGKVV